MNGNIATLIFVMSAVTIALRQYVVSPNVHNWWQLFACAAVVVPVLMLLYFLVLFVCTRGMQYFVARKPAAYRVLSHLLPKRKNTNHA